MTNSAARLSPKSVISKRTMLRGTSREGTILRGGIRSTAGVRLDVSSMQIIFSSPPGGVVVDHPAADTRLWNVTIDRTDRYGVRQTGGYFEAILVDVTRTSSGWDDVSDGTGIFLSGGVHGELVLVSLRDQTQGLVAGGDGTRVRARFVTAAGHRCSFWFGELVGDYMGDGFAALEARNHSLLYMENVTVDDNDFLGLSVHDGARAYAGTATFANTHACEGEDGRDYGGINVSARRNGTIQVENFESGHAAHAGLQVHTSYGSARVGFVHDNMVGLNLLLPAGWPFDEAVDCLSDAVIYLNNNHQNLDTTELPVPPDGLTPSSYECPTVEWVP
jgi:hypothetical protein